MFGALYCKPVTPQLTIALTPGATLRTHHFPYSARRASPGLARGRGTEASNKPTPTRKHAHARARNYALGVN